MAKKQDDRSNLEKAQDSVNEAFGNKPAVSHLTPENALHGHTRVSVGGGSSDDDEDYGASDEEKASAKRFNARNPVR
jgi:hypothetical protein